MGRLLGVLRLFLSVTLFVTPLLASGCQTEPAGPLPEAEPDPVELAVSVNSVPILCGHQSLRSVPSDTVALDIEAMAAEASIAVTLNDAAVVPESTDFGLSAQLTLTDDSRNRVRITAENERGVETCEFTLLYSSQLVDAMQELGRSSERIPVVTRSERTGLVSNAVVNIPTEGETLEERADNFITAQAEAGGVDASMLQRESVHTGSDGWSEVLYHEYLGTIPVRDGTLTLTIDPDFHIRLIQSGLYIVESEPTFVHSLGDILAMAEVIDLGEVESAQRVIFDPANPRGGWAAICETGDALIDDASLEIIERTSAIHHAPTEVIRTAPDTWITSDQIGHARPNTILRSDSDHGRIDRVGGISATTVDVRVLQYLNNSTRYTERTFGVRGFGRSNSFRGLRWPARTAGTARAVVANRAVGAFYWERYDAIFLAPSDTQDVVCHEVGHALHANEGSGSGGRLSTFTEGLANAFTMDCSAATRGGDRYIYYSPHGSALMNSRTVNYSGFPAWADYDAFLRTTNEREVSNDTERPALKYSATLLLTHALYRAEAMYGLRRDQSAQLNFAAFDYRGYATYAELRDRYLSTALLWSETGRFGVTPEAACALARGFRDVKLDGEYGRASGRCGEAGGQDLTCTASYCPMCDRLSRRASTCRPETLTDSSPTCTDAFGERTCINNLTQTTTGCPAGQARHCWCESDGRGGGRWNCPDSADCRNVPGLASETEYCTSPTSSGSGGTPQACSIDNGTPSRPQGEWPLFLLAVSAMGLVFRRVRKR